MRIRGFVIQNQTKSHTVKHNKFSLNNSCDWNKRQQEVSGKGVCQKLFQCCLNQLKLLHYLKLLVPWFPKSIFLETMLGSGSSWIRDKSIKWFCYQQLQPSIYVLRLPFCVLAFLSALFQGQYVILIRTAVMMDAVSLNPQLMNTMESANVN